MKNLFPDMQAFHLELVTLVDQVFKESLDKYMKEADPFDGEDRIRSYVCIDVEEAIRVQLKEKYQKAARAHQKETLKALQELARKKAAQ